MAQLCYPGVARCTARASREIPELASLGQSKPRGPSQAFGLSQLRWPELASCKLAVVRYKRPTAAPCASAAWSGMFLDSSHVAESFCSEL